MTDASESLRPSAFHILLALSRAPLHGLGIADEIERATDGTVALGPGTLYRTLKEMTASGFIDEASPPEGADPRRRYYRLSPLGRTRLAEEASHLARIVQVARERDVLPGLG